MKNFLFLLFAESLFKKKV